MLDTLKKHEKLCEDYDYWSFKKKYMWSTPGKNILRFPFIIYADLECLLSKMDSCEKTPDNSYTERKAQHKPCGYSILTCYTFDKTQNEPKYYRGKDCMQNFSYELRNIFIKSTNIEQMPMDPLTDDEKTRHANAKICFLCEEEFCYDKNDKDYKTLCKVRDHCHFSGKYNGAPHSKCNLKYKVPKFIPVVFHNGSTYDNHFIIRQLAKDFKGYFNCIGENTEKYISFSITTIKKSDNDDKERSLSHLV